LNFSVTNRHLSSCMIDQHFCYDVANSIPSFFVFSTALFQSLLFEAAGRTINPVNGAVGLLWTGNWHLCQAAVETVLRGGTLRPLPEISGGVLPDEACGLSTFSTVKRYIPTVAKDEPVSLLACDLNLGSIPREEKRRRPATPSGDSAESVTTDDQAPQLLNLFI
jgi:Lateral organ boundaries (LOB) domain